MIHAPIDEPGPRRRIAILGGGVGAITAAWALTEAPDWHERLDITVYQLGWRLGGKGASGRNAAHGQRIEEHGLHIWLGWYDNAFAIMRGCYEALGRPAGAPLATMADAFKPHDHVGVAHEQTSHGRSFWILDFPRTSRAPGDDDEPTRLREHLGVALKLLARHLEASLLRPLRPDTPRTDGLWTRLRPTLLVGAARRLLRGLFTRLLPALARFVRVQVLRVVRQVEDRGGRCRADTARLGTVVVVVRVVVRGRRRHRGRPRLR